MSDKELSEDIEFSVTMFDGYDNEGRMCGGNTKQYFSAKDRAIMKTTEFYGSGIERSVVVEDCIPIPDSIKTQGEMIRYAIRERPILEYILTKYMSKNEIEDTEEETPSKKEARYVKDTNTKESLNVTGSQGLSKKRRMSIPMSITVAAVCLAAFTELGLWLYILLTGR